VHNFDFTFLFDTAWPVLLPLLVGSVPVSFLVWFIFYLPLRPMISKYQAARHHRRTHKLRRREMKKQQQLEALS